MNDCEKLQQIIDEIPGLIKANITSSDVRFKAWKTKAERFLIQRFGKDSFEHKEFVDTSFTLQFSLLNTPDSDFIKACQNGLKTTQAVFQSYLDEMNEEIVITPESPHYDNSKVFIVHGHDGELKESVARIIEKQGIEAIILSEKANQGRTIIEKFEEHSDVGGAICLFTADDIGREKSRPKGKPRARQNVVFEAGYFMGKLGRNRLVLLADSGIDTPSDLSGVVYTNTRNWQIDLLKELKAMGYTVDLNNLI